MKIYCCKFENLEKLKRHPIFIEFYCWIHPKEAVNYYSNIIKDNSHSFLHPHYESNPIVLQYLIKHRDKLKIEFYWFDGENLELLEDYNKLFTEQAEMISKLI